MEADRYTSGAGAWPAAVCRWQAEGTPLASEDKGGVGADAEVTPASDAGLAIDSAAVVPRATVPALPSPASVSAGAEVATLNTGLCCHESRPPWLEVKGGFDWCSLCQVFATDGHLSSDRHLRKVEWRECMGGDAAAWHDPAQGPPRSWGDPTQFEWRGGWWWCRICSQWADGFHVEGKRHQRRAPWAEWYLLCDSDGLACEAIGFDGGESPPAILEGSETSFGRDGLSSRQGCDPWGPKWEAAVKAARGGSARNRRRGWGGAHESARESSAADGAFAETAGRSALGPSSVAQRSGTTAQEALWRREWSEKHQQSYFWNEATGESRWDLPTARLAGATDVEWC